MKKSTDQSESSPEPYEPSSEEEKKEAFQLADQLLLELFKQQVALNELQSAAERRTGKSQDSD